MTESLAMLMVMISIIAIGCFYTDREEARTRVNQLITKNKILTDTIIDLIGIAEERGVKINKDLKSALKVKEQK